MTSTQPPTGGSETQYADQLLERIGNHTAVIGVVGLGYVGLPLAIEFARAGFRVIGFDVSRRVVEALATGRSHIQDVPSRDVETFVRSGKFTATTDPTRIGGDGCGLDRRSDPAREDSGPRHELRRQGD